MSALALSVPSLFGACLASPGNDGEGRGFPLPLSQALDQWNFSGYEGNIDRSLKGVSWVHAVATVGSSLREEDVDFSVEWAFKDPYDRPQAYLTYLGIPMSGTSGGTPSEGGGCAYPPDARAWPRCGKHPAWTVGFNGRFLLHYSGLAERFAIEKPSVNFLVVALNYSSSEGVRIHGSWKNAIVNVSHSTEDDAFLFYLRDFENSTEAGDANADRVLVLNVPANTSLLAFNFQTPREGVESGPISASPNPYYVRPDGSSQAEVGGGVSEYSNQTGRWTFVIPKEVRLTPPAFEAPILWGAFVEPARFPWQPMS